MHEALISGEVLCDLVNALQPESVGSVQRLTKRVSSNVAARHGENILNYLEACKQASAVTVVTEVKITLNFLRSVQASERCSI